MPRRLLRWRRAPLALAAALAAASALAASPPAGASGRGHLPLVEHARNLAKEPVVRAGKGKAPKKLLVKDLVRGTGTAVGPSSTVDVTYVGANWKTGKDFTQATWSTGKPTSFPLSGVIAGFARGLVGMKVGGRREIVIPPSLGYRTTATGPISAGETLVFVVDLKGVSG